jgi:uncharacterized membrane-anchored protein YitT (DUF2179 family)
MIQAALGRRLLSVGRNIGLISLGSLIWAFGMNSLMVPNDVLSGGLIGVAMLVHRGCPSLELGALSVLLNAPLFILGWSRLGGAFALYSLFGALFFGAVADLVPTPVLMTHGPLDAALLAGVICGVGSGLILRSAGSAGGLDIVAVWLSARGGIRVGRLVFAVNAAVLLVGAAVFGVAVALRGFAFLAVAGWIIDRIVPRPGSDRSHHLRFAAPPPRAPGSPAAGC